MNEHIRIRRVVEGLRNHLKTKDFGEEFRSLIASYNNSCRQLKQRLEQVDAILLSGNTSGALKMAETDPSVLDLLTLFGFAESQDLKDWCVVNGVSFEGSFDNALVHRLNEAYSTNRETDGQLEKEYRKAILKKDYGSALPIARTMARLQPSDAGAQTELKNTERRCAKQLENQLDAALHGEDIEKTRALLTEFDNLNCVGYSGGAAINEARQLVQKHNDAIGIERIKELIEQAPDSPKIDEWLELEALYDQILEIKDSLSVDLPEDVAASWAELTELERDLRNRVTRANSQRIALEKLKSVVEHAQTDRITSKQFELTQVQGSLENLLSTGRNAEATGVDINPDLQSRWQEEVLHLRAQVALKLKAQRKKRIIAGSVSLLILVVIGVAAYYFASSSKVISRADEILASKDLSGARAFANANYPDGLLLGISQTVTDRHEKVSQFIDTDEADAALTVEKLTTFESGKDRWAEDLRRMIFADGELKALYAAVAQLSHESARPIRLELDRLENELAVVRNEFDRKLVNDAELKLSKMEEEILPQLSLSQPPEKLLSAIEVANEAIDQLAAINAIGQGVISMTEDQKLRRQSFVESKETALSAIEAHNDFAEKLKNAYSMGGYNEVISEGLSVDYFGSPYYQYLVDAPKSFDEASFRKAAFGNLPKLFSDLIAGGSPAPLSPPTALLPKEVDAYAAFRFNEMVDEIQRHEISIPNPDRNVKIYSRGELENDGKFSAGRSIKVTGRIFAPYVEKGVIRFVDYEGLLVTGLYSYGNMPEFEMLKANGVDGLLSSQREVLADASNPAPFLRLIDQIRTYEEASADYRCYAIIQLFDMMAASSRSEQWGLSYLPDWKVEVEALKDLKIRNGDWLREPSSRDLNSAINRLSDFFDGVSVENLARVNRALVSGVLEAEVKYHGFLDYDEENLSRFADGISLFARSASSRDWTPIEDEASVKSYMQWAPVLSIAPSLKEIYSQVCYDMEVDALMAAQMANYLGIKLEK
jgi:hypothetical protein